MAGSWISFQASGGACEAGRHRSWLKRGAGFQYLPISMRQAGDGLNLDFHTGHRQIADVEQRAGGARVADIVLPTRIDLGAVIPVGPQARPPQTVADGRACR